MGWMNRLRRVVSAPPARVPSGCSSASESGEAVAKGAEWQELLLSHFQLLEVLGAGGYSTV